MIEIEELNLKGIENEGFKSFGDGHVGWDGGGIGRFVGDDIPAGIGPHKGGAGGIGHGPPKLRSPEMVAVGGQNSHGPGNAKLNALALQPEDDFSQWRFTEVVIFGTETMTGDPDRAVGFNPAAHDGARAGRAVLVNRSQADDPRAGLKFRVGGAFEQFDPFTHVPALLRIGNVLPETSYLQPYQNALRSQGDVFQSLLWASPATQEARFQALLDVQPMHDRTLLDVGCGYADFLQFLRLQGVNPMHYVGLEALPAFAQKARTKCHGHAMIVEGDFVADPIKMFVGAEIVVFCGSLNTLDRATFYKTLDRAYAATAEVLLFNFLCSPELAGRDYLTWHDPVEVLRFCRTLSANVELSDAYLSGDATVKITKPERA